MLIDYSLNRTLLLVIIMISISIMLIAKQFKLLLRGGIFQVLDINMVVQLLKKICTSLVDLDIRLQEITLFIP